MVSSAQADFLSEVDANAAISSDPSSTKGDKALAEAKMKKMEAKMKEHENIITAAKLAEDQARKRHAIAQEALARAQG